jgi:hypothetical protein
MAFAYSICDTVQDLLISATNPAALSSFIWLGASVLQTDRSEPTEVILTANNKVLIEPFWTD